MHIHAEGPAFFAWLPKMLGKRVVVTVHGIDWQREKWQSGLGSKFIHQGEKNAVKYADEVIVLSKGVQDYFKKTADHQMNMFEDFIGYQGSAVLDEPVQEENTAPKPPMRQKSEPPENTVLPHLPEQSVNMQQSSYESDGRGMPT